MTNTNIKAGIETRKEHPYEALRRREKADARALWAVRVLDAWRENPPSLTCYGKPFRRTRMVRHYDDASGRLLLVTVAVMMPGMPGDSPDDDAREVAHWFNGKTDADARDLAAGYVFPDLPEPVRRELGECP